MDTQFTQQDDQVAATIPRTRAIPYKRTAASSNYYEVAILIPCYNEAGTIGSVVADFKEALPYAQVYVYDNNSRDNTAHIATEAGAIVRHETQQGKGNVVRRMFRDIEADLYILVDGDDTYDAWKAVDMIDMAVRGPFDFINCVRTNANDKVAFRRGHQFGNRIITGTVRLLFGNRVEDILSGYKLFTRRFVKSFPSLTSGFEIETELAVHALELQMPIANIRGGYKGRPKGSKSKLNTLRDGRKIGLYIIDLFRQERPLWFFTWIALVMMGVALFFAIPLAITYFNTGLVPRFPTLFVLTALGILASMCFLNGLVLDTITRGRRETKMMNYLRIPATRILQ